MKVLYFCSGRYLDSPIGVHFFKRSCMTLTCALSFAEQKESAAEPVPKVKSKKRRKWCTCAISLFFSSLLFVRSTVSYVLNICTYVNNELWCVCTRLCVCMFVLLWAQDDHLDFHTAPELWALHLMFLQSYISTPQCSCSLMFPHFSVPAALRFHTSMFLKSYVSSPQCSCSPVFPQPHVFWTQMFPSVDTHGLDTDCWSNSQWLGTTTNTQGYACSDSYNITLDKRFGCKLKYCRCASSLCCC